jgi:glutamate dehydrogenase (NADP+)
MTKSELNEFEAWLVARNPNQPEFIQAVSEIVNDLQHDLIGNKEFEQQKVLQRLAEPERVISFRVCWEDDEGGIRVNRGYRIQHSGLLGPYKGGLRFHPSVNESILKFLAFEQTFKNALTGLPMGGGKGGADFDPKGRSDREIMRFCQAFMNELYRHIGENIDVPAGDINVGKKEIGYLFGQYRRLANRFTGTLTGKDIEFGGSHVRTEATGFGLIYFLNFMLKEVDDSLEGKKINISGAGNVALHAALKAIENNACVRTISNSQGTLFIENGFKSSTIKNLLERSERPNLEQLADELKAVWKENSKPWEFECDVALPCGTQNELTDKDAEALVSNKCRWLAEGANMPCTDEAIKVLNDAHIFNAPGKASNAGGVALSGLEMSQNAGFTRKGYDELDSELKSIMQTIHAQCLAHGKNDDEGDWINYRAGANKAAFKRVSSALVAQGIG